MGKVKDVVIKQQEDEELSMLQEEAHYVHTINDVVELMFQYGKLKVLMDITTRMGDIEQ